MVCEKAESAGPYSFSQGPWPPLGMEPGEQKRGPWDHVGKVLSFLISLAGRAKGFTHIPAPGLSNSNSWSLFWKQPRMEQRLIHNKGEPGPTVWHMAFNLSHEECEMIL